MYPEKAKELINFCNSCQTTPKSGNYLEKHRLTSVLLGLGSLVFSQKSIVQIGEDIFQVGRFG